MNQKQTRRFKDLRWFEGEKPMKAALKETYWSEMGHRESFLATITVVTEETPETKAFVAQPGYFISKGRKSWEASLAVVYLSLADNL